MRGYARFDRHIASCRVSLGEAWGFERGLNIHPVIDNVRYELGVSQRLIGAAHNAETDVLRTALHQGRNDGVKRPLSARENVRVSRIEREPSTAVLQNKAHALDRNAGAELREHALNPAGDVAVAIDHSQISGV